LIKALLIFNQLIHTIIVYFNEVYVNDISYQLAINFTSIDKTVIIKK